MADPRQADDRTLVADEFERYVAWCVSSAPRRVITNTDELPVQDDDPSPSQRDYWLPGNVGTVRVTFERVWG